MKSLFSDPRGHFSMSKMWTNIAYGMATYVVYKRVDTLEWDFLLVYMAVVGGSELAKKYLTISHEDKDDKI